MGFSVSPAAAGCVARTSVADPSSPIAVEAGEDCDPGSSTNSTCCDPRTCKFRSGAVCDPTNDLCCTNTCQLAGSGTVCRAKADEQCDVAETCDGTSATCPADEFTKDGE